MAGIFCKRCKADSVVKNGIVRNLQRYQCKSCGFNFTDTPKRGKPEAVKDLAISLHAPGGMSLRGIGKTTGAGNVTVPAWVRDRAAGLPDVPPAPAPGGASGGEPVVPVDEMWHFAQKKQQNSGSGEHSIPFQKQRSHGFSATATTRRAESSLKKLESKEKPSSPATGRATIGKSRKDNCSPART